jgi:hypothetical protein
MNGFLAQAPGKRRGLHRAYADDLVIGFKYQTDLEVFHQALGKRMRKFVPELNEEKTRLIVFGRFDAKDRKERVGDDV